MIKSKAIVLFSGGLDSVIVVKLLQAQNIDVTALYIENGFHKGDKEPYLIDLAKKLDVKLVIKSSEQDFFNMWKNPSFGYGSAMNPCINCHALMSNIALEYMNEVGADFIASGEVLEQRGFSQTSTQLKKVITLIDNPELILRPLSAKSLPKTQMEFDNLVNRDLLLNIKGKSRRMQYSLLTKYGLNKNDVEVPAGGCILAEKGIKKKVEGLDIEKIKLEDFDVLKYGRHCMVDGVKLVLSRDASEMRELENYNTSRGTFLTIVTNERKAPIGLVDINHKLFDDFVKNGKKDKDMISLLTNIKEKIKKYVKFKKDENNFKLYISSNYEVIRF